MIAADADGGGAAGQCGAGDRELPAQLRAGRSRAAADQRIARDGDVARDVDDAVRDRLFLKGNT